MFKPMVSLVLSVSRCTVALTLALILGARGDGTGPEDEGSLSQVEAQALSSIIISQGLLTGFSGLSGLQVDGPALVPITINESLNNTAPCDLGGSVSIQGAMSGSVESDTFTGTIDMNFTEVHQACSLSDPVSGLLFTIDGSPNVTFTMEMRFLSDFNQSYSGAFSGNLRWATAGRVGACSVQIQFSGSTASPGSDSLSGTVCGQSF